MSCGRARFYAWELDASPPRKLVREAALIEYSHTRVQNGEALTGPNTDSSGGLGGRAL